MKNMKPWEENLRRIQARDYETGFLGRKIDYSYLENFEIMPTQFVYVIYLPTCTLEYVSENVRRVLGYDPRELVFDHFVDLIHPDDWPEVMAKNIAAFDWVYQNKLSTSASITFSLEYRIRKSDGTYIKVLRQQTVMGIDGNGNPVRLLATMTDMSHHNRNSNIIQYVQSTLHPTETDFTLSAREAEILRLISLGHSSKIIAGILDISVHTVNNHRSNMLKRSGCSNIIELIELVRQRNLVK